MLVVPEAPCCRAAQEQHCGGRRAGEGPSAEVEQGLRASPHRAAGNHQKGFHKEHCDLDPVSRR